MTLKSEQLCGSERDCVRTIVRVAKDAVTTGVAEGTAVMSENNRKTELAQGCETRLDVNVRTNILKCLLCSLNVFAGFHQSSSNLT